MIEKLEQSLFTNAYGREIMLNKLNELIDAYNELEERYIKHSHQTGFESKVSSIPISSITGQ